METVPVWYWYQYGTGISMVLVSVWYWYQYGTGISEAICEGNDNGISISIGIGITNS